MVVVTLICHRDQALVEPALICPALISPDQQDRLSLRIEGKGHSPDLTIPRKPKFFHVGVLRALQGVDRRSTQIGSKLSQQLGVCQQFVLQFVHQGFELSIEGIVKENGLGHSRIMDLKTYGVEPSVGTLGVKAAVARAGGNAANTSGHSLRAGYCTSAAERGLQPWQIPSKTLALAAAAATSSPLVALARRLHPFRRPDE